MSPEAGANPRKRRHARLGIFFLVLAALFVAQKLASVLPREPRLLIRNHSGEAVSLAIASPCGGCDIGRLGNGETVSIRFRPRPGCRYTIHNPFHNHTIDGDELVRIYEFARGQHEDVVLTLQYEGFADLDIR